MIVLWLLILRGTSIEFRSHIRSAVWAAVAGTSFSALSSLLLAVFYGAALGNVVRGVPLDASGYFFEPLWTNFQLGRQRGILDWYTILVGVLALGALMMHGALVAASEDGWRGERARGGRGARGVVAGGSADDRGFAHHVSRAAARDEQFCEVAVGRRVPAASGGGNCRGEDLSRGER